MSDDWTLSASKLKKYDKCPRRFELAYLEGFRGFGPENRYLRRGSAVHEAIETVLIGFDDRLGDERFVNERLKIYFSNHDYGLSEDDREFVMDCFEVASSYLAKRDPEVVAVEKEVEFGVQSLQVDRDFGGYIDLITPSTVVDWKTGNVDGKERDEMIQGAVYMAGFVNERGHPPEKVEFVYLKEEKVRSVDPSDDVWDTMITVARRMLSDVESGDFEAKPSEDKCHFCDMEVFCDASPVGAGGIENFDGYP
jgi:hypothetical protein